MDTVQEETLCSLSHGNNRGQPAQSSSLAPTAQRQIDGRRPSQGSGSRGSSPSGKRGQKPCKNDLKGNCTNPSCGCWHLPVYQNYNAESGCNLGDKCLFRHTEADEQRNCVFQDRKPPKKVYSTEERNIGIKLHRHLLQRHITPKDPSQGVNSEVRTSRTQSLCAKI